MNRTKRAAELVSQIESDLAAITAALADKERRIAADGASYGDIADLYRLAEDVNHIAAYLCHRGEYATVTVR